MSLAHPSPLLVAGLALGVAVLLAACARGPRPEAITLSPTAALPPIDRAAPERFETATFALG